MKRVMLFVFLIVSLVELDLERYRLYLLCSIASLLLVFGSELERHRKIQKATTERVIKAHEGFPSEPYVAYSPHPHYLEDGFEKSEATADAMQEKPMK